MAEKITVNRPHQWAAKRNVPGVVCAACGRQSPVAVPGVCYSEEIEAPSETVTEPK